MTAPNSTAPTTTSVASSPSTSVQPQRFLDACARLPSAVCVVTGADPDGPYGATASAVCSLSMDPLLLLVCLDNRSRTLSRLLAGAAFAVNALPESEAGLASRFASRLDGTEKFDGVAHRLVHGTPVLDASPTWFACRVHRVHDGGDHTIVVGEVIEVRHGDAPPLVWYDRRFRSLA